MLHSECAQIIYVADLSVANGYLAMCGVCLFALK